MVHQKFQDHSDEEEQQEDYGHEGEDGNAEDINEEEIVNAILQLGNEILHNLGVEEAIDDVGVFFSDAFYIQFFQAAFPEIDFSQLEEASNEAEMAQNIQALIDLLGTQILKYDLSHIKGEEIVSGNPEHCINLLQLVQEISVMLNAKEGAADGEEEDEDENPIQASSGQKQQQPGSQQKQNQKLYQDSEEDDEAQFIQEKGRRPERLAQEGASNQKYSNPTSQQKPSQGRARSYSDEKRSGGKQQQQQNHFLDMDEFDISNDFNQQMEDEEDEDQQQQQQEQMMLAHQQQQMMQQQQMQQEEEDEDDNDLDEDDLKMYEQFLAQNQPAAPGAGAQNRSGNHGQQMPQQLHDMDDDEDNMDILGQGKSQEGDEEELDLDNIDYDQLDPQILEIAEQMGVHPKEVLKQIIQMQNQEGGNEEEGEEDQDPYGQEEQEDDEDDEVKELERQLQEEQLRKEKEAFKAQMGLSSEKKRPQAQQQPQQPQRFEQPKPQSSGQKPQQQQPQYQFNYQDEQSDEDEDSYYSEGEIKTRIKLLSQKSYSAPYIILQDCFDEPLYDDEEDSQLLQRAYSTTMLQSLEGQLAQAQAQMENGEDGEGMDEQTAQLLYQQQQKMQQQHQQQQQQQKKPGQQPSKISEVSKSKESSSYANQQKRQQQQQQQHDDEEDEELDIDISQKLKEIQSQQQPKRHQQEEDDGEGDEGEDDEEMLIDLDQLDDHNKAMLLEYLQQEYEKNPDQFPFPKELIEEYMLKQHSANQQNLGEQDIESVKDIKSEEMIVEDAQHHPQNQGIEGGEQDIEDEDMGEGEDDEELTPEQQAQLQQYLMMQQQQQQQQQDYGEEQENEEPNMMMPQFQQQMVQKKKKRPQSSGVRSKKAVPSNRNQQLQIQPYTNIQEIPQDQLEAILQLLQEQQIDIENVDPNLIQQLILAQANQLQQLQMHQLSQSRPTTGKRKSSGSKKRPLTAGKTNGLSKLQPYQAPKSMKVLMPSTPGSHMKSFSTHRSKPFSNKKKKKKSTVGGAPGLTKKKSLGGASSQHPMNIPYQNYQQAAEQQQYQQQQMQQPLVPQMLDIPNLSEEFLNQLSEEQLEQLLQHQQQLMMMQQQQMENQQFSQYQQASGSKTRPKSAKSKTMKPKVPQTYTNYYNPYGGNKAKKGTKGKKKKGSKKMSQMAQQMALGNQGVMLNNYFPALEAGNALIGNSQATEDMNPKDQRYPKFGNEHINNPQMAAMGLQQDAIDEVPPEQEEGESQENIQRQPNFYHPQNGQDEDDDDQLDMEGDQDQDGQQQQEDQDADPTVTDDGQGDSQQQIELTDEQLIELIQNAHNLTPDQQAQLQLILQQRMQLDQAQVVNERAQSYQNIYHILMDNVQKAKDRLAPLGQISQRIDDVGETEERILRQKQEFEALYRLYNNELKNRETKKRTEDNKLEKKLQRESKIQAIKEKKFQDELVQHQKSLNYKRNAQQVKLCQKVYKLASELEKNKLLSEKKEYRETQQRKKVQNKLMVDAIETYYKNQITMLRERIERERFERRIAQQAQQQALARMKRELNDQKKKEVDKYLQILRQEDQKYDFESTNGNKLEREIIKMYKK